MQKKLKKIAKTLRTASRKIRGKERKYIFTRVELPSDNENEGGQQILNLLNYTKTSNSAYNGQEFPAGYHTLDIKGFQAAGQRHPKERFEIIPYDFTGKTVLDIGSNQGGMLFSIADKISYGVGIDYDYRLVNAANRIRSYTNTKNLGFYVFNLEKEELGLIKDFVPTGKVDIVFLLAVCMWIKNWKQVIDFARDISESLLFESNGEGLQQQEQLAYLVSKYKNIQLLSEKSSDDRSQQSRKLYLCN